MVGQLDFLCSTFLLVYFDVGETVYNRLFSESYR